MYKACYRIQNIYKAEINWSSLLIHGDLNNYYNVIYQPSLFALINSRYHAFKAEFLKYSHCETADFLARYMYIIQMVLTLIRATRKTTLTLHVSFICMPCSQCSLHAITTMHNMYLCNWLHSYVCLIHIADVKNFSNKMGLECHNHWFFAWEILLTQLSGKQ